MAKKTFTVQCGNVSIGDKTVGIAVKMSRDSMPITTADDTICGKRLDISLKRGSADPDQESIPGTEDNFAELHGNVEVKSFRITTKSYSFTACFMLEDVEAERLHEFAKRECTLHIAKSSDIPDKKRGRAPKGQRELTMDTVLSSANLIPAPETPTTKRSATKKSARVAKGSSPLSSTGNSTAKNASTTDDAAAESSKARKNASRRAARAAAKGR